MVIKRFRFKELIPLFTILSESVFKNLDLSGFFLPTDEVAKLREQLEDELKHYVVSYKADVFNLNSKAQEHLCALVKGAVLNDKQLQILEKCEKKAEKFGVTFVVYQKPLELMSVEGSALYKEYLKRGLL